MEKNPRPFTAVTVDPVLGKIFISDVIHKAYVNVDEGGTEAAAATAVVLSAAAGVEEPDVTITVDHPFFFAIRDLPTGALLFTGRVTDPTATN